MQGHMYPQLDRNERPNDRQAQVLNALAALKSASVEIRGFRNQKEYELWTISKLVPENDCLEEFMAGGGPQIILRYLDADNSPGNSSY